MDKQKIINELTVRQKADLLTGKDFWQTKDYPELGVPSLFLSDGPHGIRKQAAAADHLGRSSGRGGGFAESKRSSRSRHEYEAQSPLRKKLRIFFGGPLSRG